MDIETKKILRTSILASILAYLLVRLAPQLSDYIVPSIVRSFIHFPLIYISAASSNSIFLEFVGRFSGISGLSIFALLFLIPQSIPQSKKYLKAFIIVVLTLLIIIFVLLLCIELAGSHLRNLFNQALRIVGPCITEEKDRVELDSLWGSMENRDLYEDIYTKIYEYAQRKDHIKERYSRFIARHNYEIAILGGNK